MNLELAKLAFTFWSPMFYQVFKDQGDGIVETFRSGLQNDENYELKMFTAGIEFLLTVFAPEEAVGDIDALTSFHNILTPSIEKTKSQVSSAVAVFNAVGFLLTNTRGSIRDNLISSLKLSPELVNNISSEMKIVNDTLMAKPIYLSQRIKKLLTGRDTGEAPFKIDNFLFFDAEVVSPERVFKYKPWMECYCVRAGEITFKGGFIGQLLLNDLIARSTEGVFSKLPDDIVLNPENPLYLINLVSIEASWVNKFDKSLTVEKDFNVPQKPSKVQMMKQKGIFKVYTKSDKFKIIELPFDKCAMQRSLLILLPEKNAEFKQFYVDIDKRILPAMEEFKKEEYYNVTLEMPKFDIETSVNLKSLFYNMKLVNESAFVNTDLYPIFEQNCNKNIDLNHTAKIVVHETGLGKESISHSEQVSPTNIKGEYNFICDRAFFFLAVQKIENSEGSKETVFPGLMGLYNGPN